MNIIADVGQCVLNNIEKYFKTLLFLIGKSITSFDLVSVSSINMSSNVRPSFKSSCDLKYDYNDKKKEIRIIQNKLFFVESNLWILMLSFDLVYMISDMIMCR